MTCVRRLCVGRALRGLALPLALMMEATVLQAEMLATPLRGDSRLVEFLYDADNSYLVLAKPKAVTHMQFAADELIQSVAAGDTANWEFTPTRNRKNLFVKPRFDDQETSLTVLTDKRSYQFVLRSTGDGKKWYQRVSWLYGSDLVLTVQGPAGDDAAAPPAVAVATTGAVPAATVARAPVAAETAVEADKLRFGYQNSNAFGHATCALVLEPVPDRLQAMVITEGGSAVGDPSLAQIASVIGGSGGGVYATAPASIQGAVGGWNLAASTFDNRANNLGRRCDGGAGNVRVATGHPMMALWFENGDTSAAFLVRDAVPGRPELNAMNTPLVMKSVQAANAACTDTGAIAQDGAGRILSCQSGLWRASGDGSCLPTSSDLNLLEEGGRCYNGIALPNSPGGGDWVFIEVTRHYNSAVYYATQRVTGMTGPSNGKTWVRTQNSLGPGGGWTAWNQVTDPAVLLRDGSIDAANAVTALSVNALGNVAAGQGVFAAGNLTSTNGSVVTNQDAVNRNGSTYNLGESWALAGFTVGGFENREPGSARASALVNDVYLRSLDRWASQLTSMTRVGVNSLSLVSNSNYTWLTLTVSAKYAPEDGTHTAFSAWSLFINGAFVTSVVDSVNVGKFGASGHYWAYESFGVEQKQFNIFVPKGALVQVISGGANLLIGADLRVDLTP